MQSPAWPEGPPSGGTEAVRGWFRPAGRALRSLRWTLSPRAAARGKWLSIWEALCWALSSCLDAPRAGDGSTLLASNSAP